MNEIDIEGTCNTKKSISKTDSKRFTFGPTHLDYLVSFLIRCPVDINNNSSLNITGPIYWSFTLITSLSISEKKHFTDMQMLQMNVTLADF